MSIDSATLRRLSALRLAPEQMAGVLDILAGIAEADEVLRNREETRKAKDAERKRNKRASADIPRTSCGQSMDTARTPPDVPPFPLASPIPPLNPPKHTEREGAPAKRASRLPADWRPDADGMAYAAKQGLSLAETERQIEEIRDWSASNQGGAKLDWPATWRRWCRTAAERMTTQSGARNDRHSPPQRPDSHPGSRRKHTMASVELEDQAWAKARERGGPVGFDRAFDRSGTLDLGPLGASAFGLDGASDGRGTPLGFDADVVRLHVAGGRGS